MNKYLWFAIGLISGSVATYYIMKDEFERIADEEIESVKEMYKRTNESRQKVQENTEKKEAYMATFKEITDKAGYMNYGVLADQKDRKSEKNDVSETQKHNIFDDYSDDENIEETQKYNRKLSENDRKTIENPYTISPELFVQDKRDYDKITLEYYDDGFLVEEIGDDVVPDIASVIGYESLNKFGEYEEDVVYVRNDKLETDYEVIRQHCNYSNS